MPNFSDESHRRRSIYLLPNAFTTANLFAGFSAVVQAMNGRFDVAAIAIFVAMVFDGMDGRVTRPTTTPSAFGEHYESLSDMASFGSVPARVVSSEERSEGEECVRTCDTRGGRRRYTKN